MPLTVSTGLQKKVGTANYGSVGASCNVTFEADHSLLDSDLDAFQQKVKNAFIACRQAVNDQLARELNADIGGQTVTANSAINNGVAHTNGSNGHNGNGAAANGNGQRNGHPASEKQIDYARQLATSIKGLGVRRLEALAGKLYGKPLATLTSMDASGLIDTLKGVKDGKIGLPSVLEGNAA